jgi:branched-chain amino acid transport system substrate-binding protein
MKKLMTLLLAASLTLSLAACGGPAAAPSASTSPSASTGAEPSAPAEIKYSQGASADKILIANSAATSGAYAPVGVPFIAGIQAYLDMVNSGGGIDGRKIEFLHVDDEFDPVKGKAALQNFVEDEKVFAIVGHFGTPVVGATIDDLKSYGIPSVYFATGIGQLYAEGATTNEEGYNIFPVQPIYTTEGQIMVARGVGNFGATKIGIIYTNDDAGKDMLKGAEAKCKELGVEYQAEQVTAGAADVSAAVTSIKNGGADFIICAAIQATMPTIVKELAAQGMTAPVITTYVNVSSAIPELVASDVAGKFDVYGNGWVAYDDQAALSLYQEWISKIDESYKMNAYAQTGWIAAHFFCEGLRRIEGQDITWENYMNALETGGYIQNPFGGKIDYAGGTRAGTQEMNLSKINSNVEGGWELVYGLDSMENLLSSAG